MGIISWEICGWVSSIFYCSITAIFLNVVTQEIIITRLIVPSIILARNLQAKLISIAPKATSILISWRASRGYLSFTGILKMWTPVLSLLPKKFGPFNLLFFLGGPITNILFSLWVPIDAPSWLRHLPRCASHLLSGHWPSWFNILLRGSSFWSVTQPSFVHMIAF